MSRADVLPDGRTFAEAVEENLAERRDDPITDWVGADAQTIALLHQAVVANTARARR